MECPHCGSIDNKVIDSRLTGDRVSIRRRRQCLTCSERFTTYESTEERMLPVLIRKKAGYGLTKGSFKTMLPFISNTLRDLSDETKKLVEHVDKLQSIPPVSGLKRKAAAKGGAGRKAPKKTRAVPKTAALTATETVLRVIRRYRKGVGIAALKAKTGFGDKKIRNIVHRAVKQRKIRRVGRGVYANHTEADDRPFGSEGDERPGNIPGTWDPRKRGL